MAASTTRRPVDLAQLTRELGGAPLSLLRYEDQVDIVCHDETVTEAELRGAIEAHVPHAPGPATVDLQARLDEVLLSLLGTPPSPGGQLGARLLALYADGSASAAALDAALDQGWITADQHAAVSEPDEA